MRSRDSVKGHYVIIAHLPHARAIRVGALGERVFPRGFFAYVGSALGGLEGRLRRHLHPPAPRPRWHIDYLLQRAPPREAIWALADGGRECPVARMLSDRFEAVKCFGASDCRCPSHLFHSGFLNGLRGAVAQAFRALGRKPVAAVLRGDQWRGPLGPVGDVHRIMNCASVAESKWR